MGASIGLKGRFRYSKRKTCAKATKKLRTMMGFVTAPGAL